MDRKRAASPASSDPAWIVAGPTGAAAFLTTVGALPRTVWRRRDWLALQVARALRSELSGTVLGWAWPLLRPAALFAVYGFFFHEIVGWRLEGLAPEHRFALGAWMATGAVLWSGFADALVRATTAFTDASRLVRRASFPTELLPLAAAIVPLCWTLVAATAFVGASAVTSFWPVPPPTALALVPLLCAIEVMLLWGLGLVLGTLHVHLRDTQHAVVLALSILVFATPVFWVPSAAVVPGLEPWLGLLEWNPLHHLLQCWRLVLLGGEPALGYTGSFGRSLAIVASVAAAVLVLGSSVFERARRSLFDEV